MAELNVQGGDVGKVTNCSAVDCAYNEARRCLAPHVDVGRHGDQQGRHADCETYTLNEHGQKAIL